MERFCNCKCGACVSPCVVGAGFVSLKDERDVRDERDERDEKLEKCLGIRLVGFLYDKR